LPFITLLNNFHKYFRFIEGNRGINQVIKACVKI